MKLTALSSSTLLFGLIGSLGACAVDSGDTTAVSDWREAIVASPLPDTGCFHAAYPDMTWEATACIAAPDVPFASRVAGDVPFTVGNGDDFALKVSGKIAKATGTFPKVSGVKTEKDDGTKNTYSLQLNSNFMSGTAACEGVAGCQSWAQFVYSTSEKSAFIQNWLIGIGDCPNENFNSDGEGDCFINSAAASVPGIAITDLAELKISGAAVKGGNDTLVFAKGTEAFTTSEKDSITDLASAWTAAEFNVIGDGGASEAVFNTGSSVTVKISVDDHTTSAPKCVANDGTTGETNNLKLGSCKASGGSAPAIEFTESH